jgi:hypothetical protein
MKAFIIAFVLTLVNFFLCKYTQGVFNYENLVSQIDLMFKVKNKQPLAYGTKIVEILL